MRNLHPVYNVGSIKCTSSGALLGSAFIFRQPNAMLTAAHCVRDVDAPDLEVDLHAPGQVHKVVRKEIHENPNIDLALIWLDYVDERTIAWPANDFFDDRTLGFNVTTCAFPDDDPQLEELSPRAIKGHIQRFVSKKAKGDSWIEAELSFRCPKGLSGSPVYNTDFQGRMYAVVIGEREASTELDRLERIEEDGSLYLETRESVIYYGRALWLPSVGSWVDARLPRLSNDENNRRASIQRELDAADKVARPL